VPPWRGSTTIRSRIVPLGLKSGRVEVGPGGKRTLRDLLTLRAHDPR
jgi:hypothetical protein